MLDSMRSPRPSSDSAPLETVERQPSKISVRQVIGKSHVPVRRMGSRMKRPKVASPDMRDPLEGLDREEALWYMSLPEKVQKRLFTPEEHRILRAASEVALLCIREEVHSSYHASLSRPCVEPSIDVWEGPETKVNWSSASDDSTPTAWSGLVSHRLDSPFSSEYSQDWMDQDQMPCTLTSPHAKTQSSLRHGYTSEFDAGRGRISSWLRDTERDGDRREAIQDTEPRYYQDPDTRTKLRQHLLTTEAFDELLGNQFPKDIDAVREREMQKETRANTPSTPSQYISCLQKCGTASPPSSQECGSLMSVGLSEDGAVTPVSAVRRFFGSVHEGRSANSLECPKESTTFRITLTQPKLVRIVGEDNLDNLDNLDSLDSLDIVDEADPWALEPLTALNNDKSRAMPLAREGLKRRKTLQHVVKFLRR